MENRPQHGLQVQTPEASLRTTRAVWAALLLGQLGFLVAVVVMWNMGRGQGAAPEKARLLFYLSLLMLLSIPVGYVVRSQMYKSGWEGNAVSPKAYFLGNLVLLALCEGVSLAGLVATFMNGSLWPTIVPSAIAMGVQAINFPHGGPMQPTGGPRL